MLQNIKDDTKITRMMEVVAADMDGETVMLSIASGKYYGIDAIGSKIWELLSEPKTLSEVVRLLCEEYDVEPEQCRADVVDFLNYLCGEGLVKLD